MTRDARYWHRETKVSGAMSSTDHPRSTVPFRSTEARVNHQPSNPADIDAWSSKEFSDLLADVADVFAHRVDSDGADTLLQACLEVSGATDGTVFLDDIAGRLDIVASTRTGATDLSGVPSPVVARALVSMKAESTTTESGVVHAFPLRSRGHAIGAVELTTRHQAALDMSATNAVQSLVDIAATTIEHLRTLEQTARLVGQLQTALEHRVVLEQAKGVLAERLGVDCHAAFREIRNTARREQKPITEVAHHVVSSRTNGNGQAGFSAIRSTD